jgi:exocyst complex component 4
LLLFSDKTRDVPAKVTGHISKKHYLHATQLLVKSLSMAGGSLKDVGALADVFAELRNKSKVSYSENYYQLILILSF